MAYMNLRMIFTVVEWEELRPDVKRTLDSVSMILNESNQVMQLLIKSGHAASGKSLLDTVKELINE